MPVYGGSSASGKQKKRKVKRSKPTVSTPNAILGGKGVKKTEKARKSYDRKVVRRKARELNVPTKQLGVRTPTSLLEPQVRAAEKARKRAERESKQRTRQAVRRVEKAIEEDESAVAREFFGTEGDNEAMAIASLLPPVKGVRAASAILKAAKPAEKAASTAGKVGRLGAKARKAEKAGKTRAAARARKGERKAAAKVEKKARKNREAMERAARGESGGKAAAKRAWKKHQPASLTKPGRQVKRRKRAQGLATIGAGAPAAATVAAGTGVSTVEALKEDPVETLKTTARVVPGIPAAVIGDLVDVGKAVGGDEKAWEGLKKSQVAYWEQVAKVAKGDSEGAEIVKKDLGLVPAATGALTAAGFAKAAGGIPRVRVRKPKQERLVEKSKTAGTKSERKEARDKIGELDESPVQQRRRKMTEAKRSAATRERIEGGAQEDVKVTGRGRKRLDRRLKRAAGTPVTKDVSEGDLIQFLGREGLYGRDKDFILREVAKRKARLTSSKKDIDDADVATRDVVDAILDNPRVLDSKNLRETIEGLGEAQKRQSVRRHSDRTQAKQATPDPDDQRARLLHVAQAEDILLPEERIPTPLRGKTKVTPRKGQNAAKAVRGEATSFRQRAKRLEAQAAALRKNRPERAKKLDERAELYRLEAEARTAIVNRLRRASSLEKTAAKVEGPEADRMLREAQQLRREFFQDEAALRGEFVQEAEGAISTKPYEAPIYFRESDVSDQGALNVAGEYTGGRMPKSEQMRSGSLARQGRIDESASTLVENFYRQRQSTEMRTHVRSFLDDNLLDVNGKVHTGEQWRKLAAEGKVPKGYVPFPVQEWNRVLQNGRWDEAQGLMENDLMGEVRLSRALDGKKYGLVPVASKQEFRAQMEPMGKGWRGMRQVARAQAVAMLGTSPAWFALQVPATVLALAVHQANPARWVKVGAQMTKDWRKVPKSERRDFQSHFGGTSADAVEIRPQNLTLNPDTVRSASDAAKVAMKTPMGKVVRHLANGGPLIAGNRKYEAAVRTFAAALEMDRQINPSRVKRFAQAVAGVHDATQKELAQLRGKNLPEKIEALNRNPSLRKPITDGVDDAMGNWNALTSAEKKAASVFAFYPFLRFSLRWALISMPKNHPIKSAILLNAAQQNAEELDDLTGGGIGFFSDWGNVVTHGDEPTATNLSRIAPGSNAVIEAIGGGNINLATVSRAFQPLFGAAALGLAKQDPFTGETEEDMTRLEIVARQIIGLSPLSRPLAQGIGPERSDIAKAFDKIENRKRDLPGSLVPDLTAPISEMQESARLSKLLEAIGNRPTGGEIYEPGADVDALRAREKAGDSAQKDLDRILIELGITDPAEQRKVRRIGGKNYGKVKYGNSGSSSSGLGSSGLGSGGLGSDGL